MTYSFYVNYDASSYFDIPLSPKWNGQSLTLTVDGQDRDFTLVGSTVRFSVNKDDLNQIIDTYYLVTYKKFGLTRYAQDGYFFDARIFKSTPDYSVSLPTDNKMLEELTYSVSVLDQNTHGAMLSIADLNDKNALMNSRILLLESDTGMSNLVSEVNGLKNKDVNKSSRIDDLFTSTSTLNTGLVGLTAATGGLTNRVITLEQNAKVTDLIISDLKTTDQQLSLRIDNLGTTTSSLSASVNDLQTKSGQTVNRLDNNDILIASIQNDPRLTQIASKAEKTYVVSKSADYTMTKTDRVILVTTGSSIINITLPTPLAHQEIDIKKVDAGSGSINVIPSSGKIDGANTKSIAAQNLSLSFVSDGTGWYIV